MNDIEKSLERITNVVTTLADLLREIDEQRERDRKEFDRRISALEYAYIRHNVLQNEE